MSGMRPHTAHDDEGLDRERGREAGCEELREAVIGEHRDVEAAIEEDDVQQDQSRDARQPELLRDRGEDEVRLEEGDVRAALGREQDALPRPEPKMPPLEMAKIDWASW